MLSISVLNDLRVMYGSRTGLLIPNNDSILSPFTYKRNQINKSRNRRISKKENKNTKNSDPKKKKVIFEASN